MKVFAWLAIFLVTGLSYGQDIDSLFRQLSQPSLKSKERVDTYSQLAWKFRDIRPDSTVYFANQAVKIATEADLAHETIKATNYLGVGYRNLSMYTQAMDMYLKALSLAEQTGDTEQQGYALINIANLNLFQKDFSEAREYLFKALDKAQVLEDKNMQAYVYLNLGRVHKELEEYDLAEEYFDRTAILRREIGDEYGLVSVEIDKAEVVRLKGEYQKSLQLLNQLKPRVIAITDLRGLARVHNSFSKVYLALDDYKQSIRSATDARRIARSLSLKYDEIEALENLSNAYAAKEDYEKAFDYHVQYWNLNYSVFSEEKIRQIEQLKSQTEIQKQVAENEMLREQKRKQQIISFLLATGSLLLLALAFIAYKAYIIKKRLSEQIAEQNTQLERDKQVIQRQAQKLKEIDSAKSAFFANVAHDLRTPLSLILGNLEFIKKDDETQLSRSSLKFIENSYKNCKRLVYLTDEINDIIRLEEGNVRLQKSPVRIVPFLKDLSGMFEHMAANKGVYLTFESKVEDTASVNIDSAQFEKVFYNLVSNAIKHTQGGDKIFIKVSGSKEQIIIDFEDTGEGMHESVAQNIFERFYQGESNTKTKEGLGIGLSLVKELVELHEGAIDVSSQPGIGTIFTITLPRSQAAGEHVSVTDYISTRHEVYQKA